MCSYKKGGLKEKYVITKTNGKEVDPKAIYFVLRVDKDPHAIKAMISYRDSILYENPELAEDLRHLIAQNL